MSYSSLTNVVVPASTNNYDSGRHGYKICKITPHHMSGVLSARSCGGIFANPNRIASSNYGIGNDGDIGCYVEEENRAYTSANWVNDSQAITIEVSNSVMGGNWPISSKAWDSLVLLCVDICKRYNFRLDYNGTPSGSLTRHNMFANTDCPGPYLQSRLPELASTVNAILDGGSAPAPSTPSTAPQSGTEKYSTGTPITCTGVWSQANGGTWYDANKLAYGKGTYIIGGIHSGAEHPYEALYNGSIVGFTNDRAIDDEPSVPGGNKPSAPAPTPQPSKPSSGEKYGVGTPVCTNTIWTSSNGGTKYTGGWEGKITKVIPGADHPYLLNDGNIGWTDTNSIDSDPRVPGGGSSAPTSKPQAPSKKSAKAVADEIYRGIGNWGSGNVRRSKLVEYNGVSFADEVQRILNSMF